MSAVSLYSGLGILDGVKNLLLFVSFFMAATPLSVLHLPRSAGQEPGCVWVPPLPPFLVCGMCSVELNELNLPCGHSFCRACTSELFHRSRRCPSCRFAFSSTLSLGALPPNHTVSEARRGLRLLCRFGTQLDAAGRWVADTNGCNETLLETEVVSHEAACPFGWVTCPFAGCGVALRRKDAASHERERAEAHARAERSSRLAAQSALADSAATARRLLLRAPLFAADATCPPQHASRHAPVPHADQPPRRALAWAQMPREQLAASVLGQFVDAVNEGGDAAFSGVCDLAAVRATCRGWRAAASIAMRRLVRLAPSDERALRLLQPLRPSPPPPRSAVATLSIRSTQATLHDHQQRVYAQHAEFVRQKRWRDGEEAPSHAAHAVLQLPHITTLCLTRLPGDTLISAPTNGAWCRVVSLLLDDCAFVDAPFIASLSAAAPSAPPPMRCLRRLSLSRCRNACLDNEQMAFGHALRFLAPQLTVLDVTRARVSPRSLRLLAPHLVALHTLNAACLVPLRPGDGAPPLLPVDAAATAALALVGWPGRLLHTLVHARVCAAVLYPTLSLLAPHGALVAADISCRPWACGQNVAAVAVLAVSTVVDAHAAPHALAAGVLPLPTRGQAVASLSSFVSAAGSLRSLVLECANFSHHAWSLLTRPPP